MLFKINCDWWLLIFVFLSQMFDFVCVFFSIALIISSFNFSFLLGRLNPFHFHFILAIPFAFLLILSYKFCSLFVWYVLYMHRSPKLRVLYLIICFRSDDSISLLTQCLLFSISFCCFSLLFDFLLFNLFVIHLRGVCDLRSSCRFESLGCCVQSLVCAYAFQCLCLCDSNQTCTHPNTRGYRFVW